MASLQAEIEKAPRFTAAICSNDQYRRRYRSSPISVGLSKTTRRNREVVRFVQVPTFRYKQMHTARVSTTQYEMIGCSSKERSATRASLYWLSRITMEITTSLGSHTDSSCSFLCRPFRFLSLPSTSTTDTSVPVPLSFIVLYLPLARTYTRRNVCA